MPITKANKSRYPRDWKDVRKRILARAENRCEGSPKYPDCRIENGWFRNNTTGEVTSDPMQFETWTLCDGDRASRIALTIARLNPEQCDDHNLRAWCQRCHLSYDHEHHQINAAVTRRKGKAIGDLFK